MQFEEEMKYLTGESTLQCSQCGICSGSCPLRSAMDSSPMQIIRMVNRLKEEVLSTNTIWICNTCYSCQSRCPQGIKIPKIIEALRQMNLRNNENKVHLKDIPREEIRKLPQVALISNQRKLAT
jgi:heterodisulfide reductase subunit C